MMVSRRTLGTWLVGLAWLGVVGVGMNLLWGYAKKPGKAASADGTWPASTRITRITRIPGRPTLVMLAHPHCPCTRASVAELARLMARVERRVDAYVLFLRPAGIEEGWEQTDLWRSAAAIPGVRVVADPDGEEAARFGAATSGQTVFYDASGRLRFAGGITAARGHQGDNLGEAVIAALVKDAHAAAALATTPVYGCGLHDPEPRGGTR